MLVNFLRESLGDMVIFVVLFVDGEDEEFFLCMIVILKLLLVFSVESMGVLILLLVLMR